MSQGQNILNAIVVLTLITPGVAIITTKNPMWRLPLVVLPALMALNMKKQITSIDAPSFSVPLVGLTIAGLVYINIDKKTHESIKEGKKKRSLIFFGILAFLFMLMAFTLSNLFTSSSTSNFSSLGGSTSSF
jgi:hypothetical protein